MNETSDKLVCEKCGSEISNDFNHTLSFCTNCGAGIQNLHTNKTILYEKAEQTEETPTRLTAPRVKSKFGRNVLMTIALLAGLMVLAGIGIAGYFYWSDKNSYHPDYFGKIVNPASQTLRVIDFETSSLDPHVRNEPSVTHALFDGLTEYNNQNAEVSPSLAESWERSEDATVWTFRLRKNARWSDGQSITANDFVYSWRRALTPKFYYQTSLLLFIKNAAAFNEKKAPAEELGVRAIDDYTLEVTMEKPTPFFEKLVAQTVFRPVPRTAIEKYGEAWTQPANIVTSGAFKLKTWTPQEQIVLERNPDFWDNRNTKLEKITFLSPDKKAALSNEPIEVEDYYRRGEADVLLFMKSPSDTFVGKKDFFRYKYLGTTFLYVNTTVKPFDDVRVRQALSLALDRQKFKLRNLGIYPSYYLIPELKDYQNPHAEEFNPSAARKLMTEAGYQYGRSFPQLEFVYGSNKSDQMVVEFIKEEWERELGIKVNLKSQEFKDFLTSRKDLTYRGVAFGTWTADYSDPYEFLNIFDEDKNFAGWVDSSYQELLANANAETDPAKRYQMLSEAEKYLLEQQPVIPLFSQVIRFLCKPYVRNLNFNPLEQINWREVYIDQNLTADKL